MSIIEARGVEFRYNELERPAVKNIDFSIKAGEFISVIGSNGSGKSTLAKLLNILILPTAGELFINGKNIIKGENKWEIRENVGIVFQNPDNQLVATMVEDDVAFGPENLGIPSPEIRKRVDRALEMVGMDGFQKHSPHNLSGGQKQRVAIAGLIAMEPTCIVLDEPTAMLDPAGRKEVMDTIKFLNREKDITIILITHFMGEASLADRILVMHQGEIIKRGLPEDIFSQIEDLQQINLDVPVFIELAESLRREGYEVPDIMSVDGLVEYLC